MASSVIGALRVNLGLDSAQFNRGAREAESRASRLGSQMKKIGAAASLVGAGVTLAIRGQLTASDELGKTAQALGVPVEALSQLQHAASMSGASITGLETGLRRLSANMVEFPDKFSDLGIAVRDANGEIRPTSDVMADLADVMNSMPDGAEKTALAMDLMGRSGAELIPMFNGGAAGLRKMMEEADRLGLTITQKTALSAAEFNDNLSRLRSQMQGVVRIITAELVPVLVNISAAIVSVAQKFAGLSDSQRRFASIAAVVAVAIGPILIGLGFLLVGLTALTGPLGLAIIGLAAVGGIAAYVASQWESLKKRFPGITGALKSAVDVLGQAFTALWTGLKEAAGFAFEQLSIIVGGIGALMRGDWAAALDYGREYVNNWKDLFAPIGVSIFAEVSSWPGRLVTFGATAVTSLSGGIASRANDVLIAIKSIWEAIRGEVSAWGTKMVQVGSETLQGLIDGLKDPDKMGQIVRAVDSLGQRLITTLKNKLESKSPSKVFEGIGRDTIDGLTIGIKSNSGEAVGAMVTVATDIISAGEQLAASKSTFEVFGAGFGDLVADIAFGSRKIADVIKDLAKQILASGINSLISGLFSGGAAGGGGGLFSKLLGGIFKSFDGGGYTGDAARSGGLDGKGGFLAMMHPQETVVDHTRNGGGNQTVNIMLHAPSGFTAEQMNQIQGVSVRVAETSIASNNRTMADMQYLKGGA